MVIPQQETKPNKEIFLSCTFSTMFCSVLPIARMQTTTLIDSYSSSAAYIRQCIGLTLVQIIACRRFGAKPLSKSVLLYCPLDPKERNFIEIWIEIHILSFTNLHLKTSVKWWPFCPWGDEFTVSCHAKRGEIGHVHAFYAELQWCHWSGIK